jgi:hypothetical protein
MKRTFIAAAISLLAFPALADDPATGTLVAVTVDASYVPVGFDDNDEVQIVLDGHLPDSCYRVSHTEVLRDPANRRISVVQYARRYPGICMQSLVPFFSEVSLGVMPTGEFKIESLGAALEKLDVAEASSAGPDEFLYAPVDHVKIEFNEAKQVYTAQLDGRFTNSCMKIKEVNVINSGKTLEVLPKMEMAQNPGGCSTDEVPFSWKVDLPQSLTQGRHLLHVRSLNGKAVNQMFSVY